MARIRPSGASGRRTRSSSSTSLSVPERHQLHPADLDPVAGAQPGDVDSLSVHERAVGAFEVAYLELTVGQRRHAAVNPRHEGGVDDEIGAGGAAEGPD